MRNSNRKGKQRQRSFLHCLQVFFGSLNDTLRQWLHADCTLLRPYNAPQGYLLYVVPIVMNGTEVEQAGKAADALLGKIQTLNCGANAGGYLSWGSEDTVTSLEDFGKNVAHHFETQGFRVDNGLSSVYGNLKVSW